MLMKWELFFIWAPEIVQRRGESCFASHLCKWDIRELLQDTIGLMGPPCSSEQLYLRNFGIIISVIYSCYFQKIMITMTIKFTIKVECEQKLPFLDTLVRRTDFNFEYSIYRKPTNINALLYFFLCSWCYDVKIKKSVFFGIIDKRIV